MGIPINDKERVICWRLKTIQFEPDLKDRPLPVISGKGRAEELGSINQMIDD